VTETHDTIERARGRWRQILPAMGIGMNYLTGKRGPCPVCGGKDRFRFDDKNGDGWFYCNQCGAGPGIVLVRKVRKLDFASACREIDQIIGNCAVPTVQHKPATRNNTAAIQAVIDAATDPLVVDQYLTRRGISIRSDVLLGHPACAYYADNLKLAGYFPAIIVPITAPNGTLASVQRIYDAKDLTVRKKVMPSITSIANAAARLFPAAEQMGIAEGVETALAAAEMFDLPVWAAISEGGMRAWEPPDIAKNITIFGDNDENFVGQFAAYTLAKRLKASGLQVTVRIPAITGLDFADLLKERTGHDG
jgi:putative DNA primase/helicase